MQLYIHQVYLSASYFYIHGLFDINNSHNIHMIKGIPSWPTSCIFQIRSCNDLIGNYVSQVKGFRQCVRYFLNDWKEIAIRVMVNPRNTQLLDHQQTAPMKNEIQQVLVLPSVLRCQRTPKHTIG